MLTGDMLRRSAARFPDKPAVIWGEQVLTYAELDRAANRFARALIEECSVAKGGKVAIVSRNRSEYAVAFFGAARSGAVLVNVSVLYAADELAYVLGKADAEILFFEDRFREKVAEVRPRLAKLRRTVVIGAAEAGEMSFDALIDGRPETAPDVALDERDPFCTTYTGGTTGHPKGVLASHRARDVTAHTVMVEEAIDERDVVAVVTPMFHVAALNIMFQPAILAGATTTLLSQWSPQGFAEMAERDRVTAAFMVPTQVITLLNDPTLEPQRLATWKKLSFAGAPMPDWAQRAMIERLPAVKLTQIYGQSEMGVVTVLRHWYLPAKLGAVGRQAYNVDVAVVDPDGRPVRPGEIGEVVSRGDNLMIEYYREPEQTRGFWKRDDGWGWSGDLATIDEDGFITLVDRSKDMIISGGENIYPKEIETVIYGHEAVLECAVFGIPDDKFGEVPAAYVKLKTGVSATTGEIEALCVEHLARFKRPRLIRFVEDFPKTPIGKIQKTILKEPYWKDRPKKL
jgi:acyl-CoA synthetase (AMP-forming)/AMP-acid ligase II